MIKRFFKKIDGYKTLTGLIITGMGGLMFLSPVTAPFASETLISGVTLTMGGLAHKKIKSKKEK